MKARMVNAKLWKYRVTFYMQPIVTYLGIIFSAHQSMSASVRLSISIERNCSHIFEGFGRNFHSMFLIVGPSTYYQGFTVYDCITEKGGFLSISCECNSFHIFRQMWTTFSQNVCLHMT